MLTELRLATEAFLDDDQGLKVDAAKQTVYTTQILQWYAVDFGSTKQNVSSSNCIRQDNNTRHA